MQLKLMKHPILRYTKFILVIVILNILLSLILAYVSHNYFKGILAKNQIQWESATEEFIVAVLLAPFLETLVLQVGIFKIFNFLVSGLTLEKKIFEYLFIFISSLIFASQHSYNWFYVLSAFIGGVTLNYSYIYFMKKEFYPYLSVVCIHLLYNLSITLIKRLSQ